MTAKEPNITNNPNDSAIANYSTLLQSLYSCLSDSAGFSQFLGELCSHFNCHAVNLTGLNISPRLMTFGWSFGIPKAVENFYIEQNLIAHDTLIELALHQPAGAFYGANHIDPEARFLNKLDDSLKMWMESENIVDVAGMLVSNNDDSAIILTLYRNKEGGGYSHDDIAKLNLLAPHIRQAITLHQQLYFQSVDNISLKAALDSAPQASIVLSPLLEIIHANSKAKEWVEQVEHLDITNNNRVFFNNKEKNSEFQKHCYQLLHALGDAQLSSVAVFSIDDPYGLPIRVTLTPIGTDDEGEGYKALLMQFFDPNSSDLPRSAEIRKAFSLSPSESRVCEHLVRGFSAKEIAQKIDRKESTIRDNIKSIFLKTGYNRQVEVVAAILRTIPSH
ncbi:regulatory LuxR family protein [Sinobacterium caligoides]|uniref:Regulatory LuxR family protein n=1 Tax=Sinobacterium caligoides TaxID=933926 RepID=A0A3N2DNM3_9GAMM|nr:helix-turn-helix transcriptional regulator [Sinobacterium caligoides]ROS01397.1 regulatory LuxR family protein [Sinobacterium caligoides]